jgi:hypothetical protein
MTCPESASIESRPWTDLEKSNPIPFDPKDCSPDSETDHPVATGFPQSLDPVDPTRLEGVSLQGVERPLELIVYCPGQPVELSFCPDRVDDPGHGLVSVSPMSLFSGGELPFLPAIEFLQERFGRMSQNHLLDRVVQRRRIRVKALNHLHRGAPERDLDSVVSSHPLLDRNADHNVSVPPETWYRPLIESPQARANLPGPIVLFRARIEPDSPVIRIRHLSGRVTASAA